MWSFLRPSRPLFWALLCFVGLMLVVSALIAGPRSRSTQSTADKSGCLPLPDEYQGLPKANCESSGDTYGCGYRFQFGDKDTLWSCVLVLIRDKCKLPPHPTLIQCHPIATSTPPPTKT